MIYLNKILRFYRLLCRADISKTLWSRKLNVNVGNYPVFTLRKYLYPNECYRIVNRGSANPFETAWKSRVKILFSPLPLISPDPLYIPPYTNITLATIKIIKHIGSVSAYDELPSPWCMAAGLSSATHNRFPSVIPLFNLFDLIYSFSSNVLLSWFQILYIYIYIIKQEGVRFERERSRERTREQTFRWWRW